MKNIDRDEIQNIELSKLKPFRDHPFVVRNDEQMRMLIESIRMMGILVPAIAVPSGNDSFELISGHRRKFACEQLGILSMPVIVREVDRDTAIIIMVDSNCQREEILPSEKARAYRMKLDAIKRQGSRTDLSTVQVGQKLKKSSRDLIAENSTDSSSQIQRYLRLNYLLPELLQMVDDGKIALTPASELSFLTKEEQGSLLLTIESEQATPSLSQAQMMKKLSKQKLLTDDRILEIMLQQKKPDCWNLTLSINKIAKYFPDSYTPQKMEQVIFKLLDSWMRHREAKENSKKRI